MADLITRNPRGQFTKLLFINSDKIFAKFAKTVIKKARQNLRKRKKDATGELSQSLRADTLQIGRDFILRFWFEDYGFFVEEGVRGSGQQWTYIDSKQNRELKRVGKKYPRRKQKGGKSRFSFKQNGRMPPIRVLMKWFKNKSIQGRDKLGKYISHKAYAFIVQRNLFVNGMKPTFFYRHAFEKYYNEQFISNIEVAYALDVESIFGNGIQKQLTGE
jgi:hypothetical protein